MRNDKLYTDGQYISHSAIEYLYMQKLELFYMLLTY